jgi:hypothetical protein
VPQLIGAPMPGRSSLMPTLRFRRSFRLATADLASGLFAFPNCHDQRLKITARFPRAGDCRRIYRLRSSLPGLPQRRLSSLQLVQRRLQPVSRHPGRRGHVLQQRLLKPVRERGLVPPAGELRARLCELQRVRRRPFRTCRPPDRKTPTRSAAGIFPAAVTAEIPGGSDARCRLARSARGPGASPRRRRS